MKLHSEFIWFQDKQTLQQAAFSSVVYASGLAVNNNMASDSVECAEISSAITAVSEVFIVDAQGIKVDPLCTTFTPDLWDDHGSTQCACFLAVD